MGISFLKAASLTPFPVRVKKTNLEKSKLFSARCTIYETYYSVLSFTINLSPPFSLRTSAGIFDTKEGRVEVDELRNGNRETNYYPVISAGPYSKISLVVIFSFIYLELIPQRCSGI